MLQRVKEVQESDLRMNGALARNIQRVLAVTQADIDAAAAQGKGWLVKRVVKVNDPLDNLRGGTQLVIKQNSIQPGQNVMRVMYVGGQAVVVGPGTSPLSLPNAMADDILSLIAFGGTSQASTPTPADPVDIVSNNGVLKARHESGLPLGYTLLDYAVFDGTQVVDTGLQISTNDEIRSKVRATATGFAYGADTSNPRITLYMSPGGNQRWGTGLSSTSGVPPLNTELTVVQNKTTISYNGTDYSMSATDDFTTTNTLTIGNCNGNTTTPKFSGNFYYMEIYQNGSLAAKMVPVKASDDTVGFYDLARNQFFAPSTGTLVAGSAVSDPAEVYTDGPIETITIKDDNSSAVSTATAEMLLSVDTYTDQQEVISGSVARKCGAVILDSSFEWTYDSTYGRVNATIPNLWGSTVARTVPGFCTHFEWLSHQESISSITAGQCYSAGANRIFLHISQTSAAAFSAWLDAQKDAGTPVIIVFPLENATTESVTGQPMQTAAGDNTAEITQASLSGLELEAEYEKEGA